jgi:uncharacterized membrane protein
MRGAFMSTLIFWFFYFVHISFLFASMNAMHLHQGKRTIRKNFSYRDKVSKEVQERTISNTFAHFGLLGFCAVASRTVER